LNIGWFKVKNKNNSGLVLVMLNAPIPSGADVMVNAPARFGRGDG
jgi:hypothetical protein